MRTLPFNITPYRPRAVNRIPSILSVYALWISLVSTDHLRGLNTLPYEALPPHPLVLDDQ